MYLCTVYHCIALPDTRNTCILMNKSVLIPPQKSLSRRHCEAQICPSIIFQNTKFTPMMTVRAPEARALSHTPALPMLSACWLNGPRDPIKATQRRRPQVTQEPSRRSSRGCRAASATPVPTRRRERKTSPQHDEKYLFNLRQVMIFFPCGVFFVQNHTKCCLFLGILFFFLSFISTLPRHAAQG